MTDITGKIEKLDLNNTGTKKDGTPFTNIKLRVSGHADVITISKSSPAGKFAEKLDLKVGDEVTVVIGGQWNSVQKIMKGKGSSSFGSSSGKKFEKGSFDGDGAKRGQAMNAAVALLIHNHKDSKITDAQEAELSSLAKLVFKVSTSLEVKKADVKSDVDAFESTKDTPTATNDFDNADSSDF